MYTYEEFKSELVKYTEECLDALEKSKNLNKED